MVTSETSTLELMTEPVGGRSFLFHNVVLLRYLEWTPRRAGRSTS